LAKARFCLIIVPSHKWDGNEYKSINYFDCSLLHPINRSEIKISLPLALANFFNIKLGAIYGAGMNKIKKYILPGSIHPNIIV
jgi:hypothetical protein